VFLRMVRPIVKAKLVKDRRDKKKEQAAQQANK
jgi:hypothetical protein